MWQTVFALAVVVIAGVYVGRKFYRQLKGKESSGCPFCNEACGEKKREGASGRDDTDRRKHT